MGLISVLIPARNEKHLVRTVDDVLAKSKGDVEIIITLDGWDNELIPGKLEKPDLEILRAQQAQIADLAARSQGRVRLIKYQTPVGQRAALNEMVRQMKGEHLFKMDAHSVLMPGWDMPLRDLTGEDIFATTRMYSLDETTWTMGTRRLDFCYISNQIKTEWWTNYGQRVPNEEVSETMSFYGTTWFTSKKLWDAIGGYDTRAGAWGDSGVEFSAKAWLTGRRVLVHRGVWCAHLYRKKFPYCMSGHEHRNTVRVIRGMIREGKISGQIHGLEWLVGRFWPVPTWGNTMEESHER